MRSPVYRQSRGTDRVTKANTRIWFVLQTYQLDKYLCISGQFSVTFWYFWYVNSHRGRWWLGGRWLGTVCSKKSGWLTECLDWLWSPGVTSASTCRWGMVSTNNARHNNFTRQASFPYNDIEQQVGLVSTSSVLLKLELIKDKLGQINRTDLSIRDEDRGNELRRYQLYIIILFYYFIILR